MIENSSASDGVYVKDVSTGKVGVRRRVKLLVGLSLVHID